MHVTDFKTMVWGHYLAFVQTNDIGPRWSVSGRYSKFTTVSIVQRQMKRYQYRRCKVWPLGFVPFRPFKIRTWHPRHASIAPYRSGVFHCQDVEDGKRRNRCTALVVIWSLDQ